MNASDKVVVITGATAGIGLACAKIFAKNGYKLALGARRIERFESVMKELGGSNENIFCHYLDVAKTESCEQFTAAVLKKFKHIDVLINNAGLAVGTEKLAESKPQDWDVM